MSEAWRERSIGESVRMTKGATYGSKDYASAGEGHVFLTIKCVAKGGGFNQEGIKFFRGAYSAEQELRPEELVVAMTDLTRDGDIIGSPMITPDFGKGRKALPSMDLCILRPQNEDTDIRFLFYRLMLADARCFMWAHSAGSTVLHLESKSIPKFSFRAPGGDEQRRIAFVLDTVEGAIRQTGAVIEKLTKIKAGLLMDLLTRGIGGDGKLRNPARHPEQFQASPLGRIPRDWVICLLDDVATRGSGHTPNKNVPSYWNGGIKWVSLADSDKLDLIYISDTDKQISEVGIENSSAVILCIRQG